MTAISSRKAYLYETSGSAKGEKRKNLEYKLEGHHATLASRDSGSIKGKFALSIGRKIDLSKEKESKEIEKKTQPPVILPECKEDTLPEVMDDVTQGSSDGEESTLHLLRENTDDVPLTTELLQSNTYNNPPTICSDCANVGIFTRHQPFTNVAQTRVLNSDPCDICQKRKMSKKKTFKQDKTLLMSIVYPHDFYDRYQSARRQFQHVSPDIEKRRERKKKAMFQRMSLPKTTFTLPVTVFEGDRAVIKPREVKFKEKKKNFKSEDLEKLQYQETVQNNAYHHILPPLRPLAHTTAIPKHLRCQPQMKAYFVASMSSSNFLQDKFPIFAQRKTFKGLLLSKSDQFEKTKSETKHSFINVGSLGLTIGIPEYNEKLANRQTTTNNYLSRTFTTLTDVNRPKSMLPPVKNKVRPPGSVGHRSM